MTARFIVADVFDGLAMIEDGSVDLVVTSPPFLALRSYLPADHPDKGKEIGSEATPAEFIDVLLRVTQELRRVLAPHGSICVELGDTYSGSTMSGGDDRGNERYPAGRSQANQARFRKMPPNTAHRLHDDGSLKTDAETRRGESHNVGHITPATSGPGWPLAKSRTLIPQCYEIALAYGINPLTGNPSPAGQWRVRNIVTWARPNPPVGALGDKWRPATSDLIVACTSSKRYWDDLSTRHEHKYERPNGPPVPKKHADGTIATTTRHKSDIPYAHSGNSAGAPLLDYWVIPPGGYKGSHYAVFPEELVVPCVKAMCPGKVCRTCGEPSWRIVDHERTFDNISDGAGVSAANVGLHPGRGPMGTIYEVRRESVGFTDCGHDTWRPGLVLDPFAGSGTTLAVATGHGHDAIGIDLDRRNLELSRERVGPFFFEEVTA